MTTLRKDATTDAPTDTPPLPGPPTLGVGLVGTGFMGRVHSRSLRAAATWDDPPVQPRLAALAGRRADVTAALAAQFGWERTYSSWREVVTDPHVDLVDCCGPNDLHLPVARAALQAGKHVLTEKPLGRSADEALTLWGVERESPGIGACAFNYRFLPAVAWARRAITAGELGDITCFGSRFFVASSDSDGWRDSPDTGPGGVVLDLASHHLDLARWLVGEVAEVSAFTRVSTSGVESSVAALLRFADGAVGDVSASCESSGPAVVSEVEVIGTKASLRFSLQAINEVEVTRRGHRTAHLVTEPTDPYLSGWDPHGHPLGWTSSFVHQWDHLLRVVAGQRELSPQAATFEDGYRVAEICDALLRSARSAQVESVRYRQP